MRFNVLSTVTLIAAYYKVRACRGAGATSLALETRPFVRVTLFAPKLPARRCRWPKFTTGAATSDMTQARNAARNGGAKSRASYGAHSALAAFRLQAVRPSSRIGKCLIPW